MNSVTDRIKEKAFQLWLYWNSRPGLVYQHLRRHRIRPSGNLASVDHRAVRVAAIQMRLMAVTGAVEYADRVYRLARQAVEEGAQLVVFPEAVATHLLGLLPGMAEASATGTLDETLGKLGPGLRPAELLTFAGSAIRRIYRATFSFLARALGVYIVAGTAMLPEIGTPAGGTGIYNMAHLFGPDGRLLGIQKKTHLLPIEKDWGLKAGDDLHLFDTHLGKMAVPVCMDATYFEPFRILSLLGAEIVALPVADPDEYSFWKALRGIWPRVQESLVFGVKACLVGNFAGIKFTGRSGIFAPLPLTPQRNGVLAELSSAEEEGVVMATLDLVSLRELRRSSRLEASFNLPLYERYLPRIYHGMERAGRGEGRRKGGPHGRKGRQVADRSF